MLNATGCIELSGSGLQAMVQGLKFVELASTFYGFKPVEEVVWSNFALHHRAKHRNCECHKCQSGDRQEIASTIRDHP